MKPMEAILTQVDQIIPALQIGFSSSRNHKHDYKQNDRDDNQHQTILHPKKKKKGIKYVRICIYLVSTNYWKISEEILP